MPPVSASPSSIRVCLLIVMGLLALSMRGCGDRSATSASGNAEPIDVLATTYAMADIARAVGGDSVRAEWWIESGQSLAELVETPERRQQLNRVDLVITRGQIDPWTVVGFGNTFQDQRVLRMDTLTPAQELDPAHYGWLDPLVARELAEQIALRLGKLDPGHANTTRANADAFKREVTQLWEATVSEINRRGGGPFVSLERGFLPLAKRFGLEDVRIPNVDLREPTAFNVKQIRDVTREAGGGAVFASTETPPALLREWELRLSMPVLALDPLGTSARNGRSTYLQLLRYNLDQIKGGLALAKPREQRGPGPLGAMVVDDPSDPATTAPTQPEDDTAAATRPADEPAVTKPAKPFFPENMSQFQRVPMTIPLPTPTSQPRAVPSPFKPIPAH